MNNARRIFVEKREGFQTRAESLRQELNSRLNLQLSDLRLLCVYDLFGFSDTLLEDARYKIFAEPAVDTVYDNIDLSDAKHLAIEPLPGQFDQRAASALDCVRLLQPDADVDIVSSQLIILPKDTSESDMQKIRDYCLNPVESRLKDLSKLEMSQQPVADPVEVIEGFRDITPDTASEFCQKLGLAMSPDDLMTAVDYFSKENRDPYMTEIRILDTYWSDHCRHTTFTTSLDNIDIQDGALAETFREILNEWKDLRNECGRGERPMTLMDLATVAAKTLRMRGLTPDVEVSEENNACSIFIDVDINDPLTKQPRSERWLLQFKNETHNHPTEIEPFGGASTCLGGAIRDPLSGRSYVYQAMRVTGAADVTKPVSETMPGKLPQVTISRKAAAGYSSYGNQFGIATTCVREIFHPGYVAKRLEVGAVVGAVPANQIKRESPAPGDVVIMLGGATGRDGIGGATGSSKKHDDSSLTHCGSEVQKGNAPEERKISRLFRRADVTSIIKKSNDFGAGGVSVAIGELADGLDIYLDRVPLKYAGLNPTEIAISESQERMAVVVAPDDAQKMLELCAEENINAVHVADVTDTARMRLFYNGETVADISREFIDSAGATRSANVRLNASADIEKIFSRRPEGNTLNERILADMSQPNVASQKGLSEMFDSSIGMSTVLMPFGGEKQLTEAQVSAQTIPVDGCRTASVMAYGFNPDLTEASPCLGASYACVEALSRLAASGAKWRNARFSFQEYFEKMSSEDAWGKPLAALLGALRMQMAFNMPAIGGKDSMSGTFNDINVPPTLIAFAVATANIDNIISPEFKTPGQFIYFAKSKRLDSGMPDTDALGTMLDKVTSGIESGNIKSAFALGFGGLAEALSKMTLGNNIGADIILPKDTDVDSILFNLNYGSLVVASQHPIDDPDFMFIGKTDEKPVLTINDAERNELACLTCDSILEASRSYLKNVYPDRTPSSGDAPQAGDGTHADIVAWGGTPTQHPKVAIPVFPGTNCDYDIAASFARHGAETEFCVFRNLTPADTEESANRLAKLIDESHILAISGGFSAGDEPDGSGKFIANVLTNETVAAAINRLIERRGLILGICNGFQALVKSGLLPFGRLGDVKPDSPTLFTNDINRHISQIVTTRVGTTKSPWLASFRTGELHRVAASHGEGKFTTTPEIAQQLLENGQIAFQYADADGKATLHSPENPNGSVYAIEGIISPDGLILGKMAHSERYRDGLMKNIPGNKRQDIFANAVAYFNK